VCSFSHVQETETEKTSLFNFTCRKKAVLRTWNQNGIKKIRFEKREKEVMEGGERSL
jgi:hypothetical protein